MTSDAAMDPKQFRAVMGHLPTGVVVVSGRSASGELAGMTIGSFVSVSLQPPLAGFFIGTGSPSWKKIAETGLFCASVLGVDQEEWCWRFAKEADARFDGVPHTFGVNGSPRIGGSVAWIECDVESVTNVGDHDFVLGKVTTLEAASSSAGAMTFYRGAIGGTAR
jgi:flavin reductase (DIM6/NTAB) family NADH-FMN oxidoreductase RutF